MRIACTGQRCRVTGQALTGWRYTSRSASSRRPYPYRSGTKKVGNRCTGWLWYEHSQRQARFPLSDRSYDLRWCNIYIYGYTHSSNEGGFVCNMALRDVALANTIIYYVTHQMVTMLNPWAPQQLAGSAGLHSFGINAQNLAQWFGWGQWLGQSQWLRISCRYACNSL